MKRSTYRADDDGHGRAFAGKNPGAVSRQGADMAAQLTEKDGSRVLEVAVSGKLDTATMNTSCRHSSAS